MLTISESGRGTVDADGTSKISIYGPRRIGYMWTLQTLVVTSERASTASTDYPTASLYRTLVDPSKMIGTARVADRVTFQGGPGDWLLPGDALVVVVEGAKPGSEVTVALQAFEEAQGTEAI